MRSTDVQQIEGYASVRLNPAFKIVLGYGVSGLSRGESGYEILGDLQFGIKWESIGSRFRPEF